MRVLFYKFKLTHDQNGPKSVWVVCPNENAGCIRNDKGFILSLEITGEYDNDIEHISAVYIGSILILLFGLILHKS